MKVGPQLVTHQNQNRLSPPGRLSIASPQLPQYRAPVIGDHININGQQPHIHTHQHTVSSSPALHNHNHIHAHRHPGAVITATNVIPPQGIPQQQQVSNVPLQVTTTNRTNFQAQNNFLIQNSGTFVSSTRNRAATQNVITTNVPGYKTATVTTTQLSPIGIRKTYQNLPPLTPTKHHHTLNERDFLIQNQFNKTENVLIPTANIEKSVIVSPPPPIQRSVIINQNPSTHTHTHTTTRQVQQSIYVQKPRPVSTTIIQPIQRSQQIIEVEKPVIQKEEKIIEKPVYYEREVEKVVEKPVYYERIVEKIVEKEKEVAKAVEVDYSEYTNRIQILERENEDLHRRLNQHRNNEIDLSRQLDECKINIAHLQNQPSKIEYIEKIIEKPVEVQKLVQVDKQNRQEFHHYHEEDEFANLKMENQELQDKYDEIAANYIIVKAALEQGRNQGSDFKNMKQSSFLCNPRQSGMQSMNRSYTPSEVNGYHKHASPAPGTITGKTSQVLEQIVVDTASVENESVKRTGAHNKSNNITTISNSNKNSDIILNPHSSNTLQINGMSNPVDLVSKQNQISADATPTNLVVKEQNVGQDSSPYNQLYSTLLQKQSQPQQQQLQTQLIPQQNQQQQQQIIQKQQLQPQQQQFQQKNVNQQQQVIYQQQQVPQHIHQQQQHQHQQFVQQVPQQQQFVQQVPQQQQQQQFQVNQQFSNRVVQPHQHY